MALNTRMVSLMMMIFFCSSKDILESNSYIWHQKYFLPCTKLLGCVACRVTPNILGIRTDEQSWDDIHKIKYGKRYSVSSDVSEKQIIVYKSACI